MWQAQFSCLGEAAEVVELVETAAPDAPRVGEVIVRILAFPINPSDLLAVSGRYAGGGEMPSPLGAEAVGVVEDVGQGVSRVSVGDRVILLSRDNWRELRCVPETEVVKVPLPADLEQMAMLKVNPATASLLLSQIVDLQPSDWIVQAAGGSAVGRCVAALAKMNGVRVVSVIRGDAPSTGLGDVVLSDGEDLASRVREVVGGAGCALALDPVAGALTARLADCLRDSGVVTVYGGLSGEACALRPDQAVFRDIRLRGFWLTRYVETAPRSELDALYATLADAVEAGRLCTPVEASYPIASLREALRHAARPDRRGKVIVTA